MTRPRTLAVATAATLLVGLGTFGATTAFASSPTATPATGGTTSASAQSSRTGDPKNLNAMLQQCVKHVPAKDRAEARKQMRDMMSGRGHGSGSSGSMMGGGSGTSMGGMMGGSSGTSTSGMMQGLGGGS
ncbi:hypothetical protein [Streptomyces sp. YIM S03343]